MRSLQPLVSQMGQLRLGRDTLLTEGDLYLRSTMSQCLAGSTDVEWRLAVVLVGTENAQRGSSIYSVVREPASMDNNPYEAPQTPAPGAGPTRTMQWKARIELRSVAR